MLQVVREDIFTSADGSLDLTVYFRLAKLSHLQAQSRSKHSSVLSEQCPGDIHDFSFQSVHWMRFTDKTTASYWAFRPSQRAELGMQVAVWRWRLCLAVVMELCSAASHARVRQALVGYSLWATGVLHCTKPPQINHKYFCYYKED